MSEATATRDQTLSEITEDIKKTLQNDSLICQTCKNPLKNPRYLPCHHVLCLSCFSNENAANKPQAKTKKSRSKEKKVQCPFPGCGTLYDPQSTKTALDINLGRSLRFFTELSQLAQSNIGTNDSESKENEDVTSVHVTTSAPVEENRPPTSSSSTESARPISASSGHGSGKKTAAKPAPRKGGQQRGRPKKTLSRGADDKQQAVQQAPHNNNNSNSEEALNSTTLSSGHAANIDKKNAKGETALQRACTKNGAIDEVRRLLEAGANPNVSDNAGWTPLHEAAQRGDAEVIGALIQKGANVNVMAEDGTTPLHDVVCCTAKQAVKAIEVMLKAGANPSIPDFNHKTPIDIARTAQVKAMLKNGLGKMGPNQGMAGDVAAHPSTDVRFAMSGFNSSETSGYEKRLLFCRDSQLMGRLCISMSPDVTHLVVTTLPDDPKVATRRSLKFLQGVACGCWIVSQKWLDDSLSARRWLPEAEYEVDGCARTNPHAGGPHRSRLSHHDGSSHLNEPPLFSGCGLFLQGRFEVPTSIDIGSLRELCQWAGATLLKREPRVNSSLSALGIKSPPVYHAPPEPAQAREYSAFIVRDPAMSPLSPGHQIRMPPLATVTYDWLLSCIEKWQIEELPSV